MARPTPATRISAVAVTLLLSLQLLLLPSPASSAVAARRGVINPSSMRQFGNFLYRQVIRQGRKQASRGSSNKDQQLGSAAADDVGYVVLYNVSVGPARRAFSGVVSIVDEFFLVQCPPAPAPAFSRVPCASLTCQSALNITADDCGTNSTGGGDCEYIVEYVAGNTTGYLAAEAFTLVEAQPVIAGPVVFGCSDKSTMPLDDVSGIVGFSRGNLSLISQLNISRFAFFSKV